MPLLRIKGKLPVSAPQLSTFWVLTEGISLIATAGNRMIVYCGGESFETDSVGFKAIMGAIQGRPIGFQDAMELIERADLESLEAYPA